MEWLSTEAVVLVFTTLVASGLLILGTLTLVRPPRPRNTRRLGGGARRIPLAAPALQPGRSRTRELPPPGDRAALARRLGRTLLDRAAQEWEPERRRTLIYRAIACLNRGIQAAPDDEPLRETLTAAHAALWNTYQQVGLERLAREMPWRATVLAPAPPAPGPLSPSAGASWEARPQGATAPSRGESTPEKSAVPSNVPRAVSVAADRELVNTDGPERPTHLVRIAPFETLQALRRRR